MLAPQFVSIYMNPMNLQQLIVILDKCLQSQVMLNGGSLSTPVEHYQFRVLIATIRTISDILMSLPNETASDALLPLVPSIIVGLNTILQLTGFGHKETVTVTTYIENMIDMAESVPYFFANTQSFHVVFESSIMVWLEASLNAGQSNADSHALHPVVRNMLLEFLVVLCCQSPKMVRKYRGQGNVKNYFALKMFPACLYLMQNVPDDPKWLISTVSEDQDMDTNEDLQDADVGEAALDRMCQALGLKNTYSLVSSQLVHLFNSPNWKEQHAGLRYLGNYMEVSKDFTDKKQLVQHRKEVLTVVMQFSRNSNHRVRAAAYYALNQFLVMHGSSIRSTAGMSSGGGMEQQLVKVVLPNILESIPASCNPSARVRRYVMACLVNLIDCCMSVTSLEQASASHPSMTNAGIILKTVVDALHEGPLLVQEYSVTIIMSIAENMRGAEFIQYYDALMPILKQLLHYTEVSGLESLWGQVIECCAMVGEAAGKTKFYADATSMMNHLGALSQQVDEDSEVRRYILKAWVRIA